MAGLVVVGGGPLIGTSVVKRFVRDGHTATVVARSSSTLQAMIASVRSDHPDADVHGIVADATDEHDLRRALDQALVAHGAPEIVLYNAALIRADRIGDLSAEELVGTLAVNVVGAVTTGAHLLPHMISAGGGSLFFTGGMPSVKRDYASLSLGKASLRTVADLFRAEAAGEPIHVATVTVRDAVRPGTDYDPRFIADVFAELHAEEPNDWRAEVRFGGAGSEVALDTRPS
jgi:NAD(P)-dependent dehydrogenase (short-subunit alcohol dehydrogenase family)